MRGRGLLLTDVWGFGWMNFGLAGESFHEDAIRALLPAQLGPQGAEVIVEVSLFHEADNAYDRNAVAVQADFGVVGYIPRESAPAYALVLDRLNAAGRMARTKARVWGSIVEDWDGTPRFMGSVSLDLPEPHLLFPINESPRSPHVMLPLGRSIQVNGEELHLANLAPWLTSSGGAWVYATVASISEVGPRSSKTFAEISIDGSPVGRLTPKMSGELLPAVDHFRAAGAVTCVRAIVRGNSLKCDVTLYCERAGELDQRWLEEATARVAGQQSSSGLPPAAWYADPQGVHRLRWWDGASWTSHVAD